LSEKKLKVLFVSKDSYYPENRDGISKINYNLVVNNSLIEPDYLTQQYVGKAPDESSVENHLVFNCPPKQNSKLKAIFSLTPYNVYPKEELKGLAEQINSVSNNYDVIHISTLFFGHLPSLLNEKAKIFFSSVDCHTLLMRRKAASVKNPIFKFLYYLESLKYKALESKLYGQLNKCHFVSNIDSEFAQKNLSLEKPITIPNGINTKEFYDQALERDPFQLIFTGNFNYHPNQEAAEFIITKIAPELYKKDPRYKIILAGANPTPFMQRTELPNVIITGRVESLTPYLQKSNIFICPLFSGAGIKNKLLEAMASGLFSICSEMSLDGIPSPINFKTIRPAQNVKEWIQDIIAPGHSASFDKGAVSIFVKRFSWETIKESYLVYYS
tara:strand:+ start:117158 stop:118312 length:1155 start_codon:yes stop_codon:yes gene_type:complete